MSVDIKNIKPGDSVTVSLTVTEPSELFCEPGFWLTVPDMRVLSDRIALPASAIISHIPRSLAVGDRVRLSRSHVAGKILAIDGDAVWVRWDYGDHGTRQASVLERVDE